MSTPLAFISYSTKDRAFCDRFAAALREAQIDAWYFDHDNPYGSTISQIIAPELQRRQVFILLLSKAALNSNYVFTEFDVANYLRLYDPTLPRLIIPVVLERLELHDYTQGWPFLLPFPRVAGPDNSPLPFYQMVSETLRAIAQLGDVLPPPQKSPELTLQPLENTAQTNRAHDSAAPDHNMAPMVALKKVPVYLLLDTSVSMKGEPIAAVNNGVRTLYNELVCNLHDRGGVSVGIITFSYRVDFAPLTPLSSFVPPIVTANNLHGEEGTSLGGALKVLKDELAQTNSAEQAYVFLLTDGDPTDGADWRQYSLEINYEQANKIGAFYGVGCGPQANLDILRQICREVVFIREFTPQAIRKAFGVLARQIQDATLSLPPPPFTLS